MFIPHVIVAVKADPSFDMKEKHEDHGYIISASHSPTLGIPTAATSNPLNMLVILGLILLQSMKLEMFWGIKQIET